MFNVINTILFLPFANQLANLATRIIPPDKVETISLGSQAFELYNYQQFRHSNKSVHQRNARNAAFG